MVVQYFYSLSSSPSRWEVSIMGFLPAMRIFFFINPFTAPASKISRLKSAHIHAWKQYIWWSHNKSTFTTVHFNRNPFMWSFKGGKKALIVSNLALFFGHFRSDGAISVAVKGLRPCVLDTAIELACVWVLKLHVCFQTSISSNTSWLRLLCERRPPFPRLSRPSGMWSCVLCSVPQNASCCPQGLSLLLHTILYMYSPLLLTHSFLYIFFVCVCVWINPLKIND